MESRGDSLKFLVTDYDKCAFTVRGSHPRLLSSALTRYALMSDYNGFYGCTHRSYTILPILLSHATKKASETNYDEATITAMFPTYAVTENFAHETNLACMGVSTVDDLLGKQCGDSYETIIKPFEKDGARPSPDLRYVTLDDYGKYTKSKNQQLTQVAKHAALQHPDAKITLDYVDDNVSLCRKALEVPHETTWPAAVALNVFHHDSVDDDAPIVAVKPDRKVNYKPRIPAPALAPAAPPARSPSPSLASAMRAIGVFAATGSMSTYGTPRPSDNTERETRSGKRY